MNSSYYPEHAFHEIEPFYIRLIWSTYLDNTKPTPNVNSIFKNW